MKAVIIPQPHMLEIADLPKPVLEADDDVIIRITSAGICGSDIGIYLGTNSLATYPRLIGHEFGGIVEAVGAGVSSCKVGDLVAVDPTTVSATNSYAIRVGRYNVDRSLRVMGVHRDGGFAEFVSVPAANVHRFEGPFDPALLGVVEPYTIGWQICERAGIASGDRVLILGAGPIGSCAMQIARSRGARVIITDILDRRLERAAAAGADVTINTRTQDLDAAIAAFTDDEGIEVIVDSVCRPETLRQAVLTAAPAGRVVCLTTAADEVSLPAAEITKKELTIYGSRLTRGGFPHVIAEIEAGRLDPARIVSHRYPLERAETAIRHLIDNPADTLKVVLDF